MRKDIKENILITEQNKKKGYSFPIQNDQILKQKDAYNLWKKVYPCLIQDYTQLKEKDTNNICKIFSNSQQFQTFTVIDKLYQNEIVNKDDVDVVSRALILKKLTHYEFYYNFIQFCQSQQFEKLKIKEEQNINKENFLKDVFDFSTSLALNMFKRNLTSVQYNYTGEFHVDYIKNSKSTDWKAQYFEDFQLNGEYKKLLRKCSLLKYNGDNYYFVHKSIQDFFVAHYFLQHLQQIQVIEKNMTQIGKIFAPSSENQKPQQFQQQKNQDSFKPVYEQQSLFQKGGLIDQFCQQMKYSIFNDDQLNISNVKSQGLLYLLQDEMKLIKEIKQRLYSVVKLSSISSDYIKASSNCLFLLSQHMKFFKDFDFKNIKIVNINLKGLSFYGCDLQESEFQNVDISCCQFNNVNLKNIKWSNIIYDEQQYEYEIFDDKMSMNKQQYISQKDDKKIELLQFSPENRKLASWGENQPVTIWNIKNGMHICKLQLNNKQRVKTLEFSHDMSFLLITYSTLNSVSVIIWYYKRNQQISIHNPHLSNININQSAEIIQSIEINVDLGGVKNCVKKTQISKNSEIQSIEINVDLEGIKNCFKKTQISRNCQILACYSDSSKIILWDAISGKFHKALSEHKQEIVSLDFSPNGKLLASASFDSIILRNMKNDYKILYEFQNDNCKFIFIYFSPNNEILASGSTDQVIRLWNVKTGDEFDKIVNLQSLDLNSLFLFSADSNQIIFKRSKNQVQIYNIKNNNAKLIGTNPCYENIFWGTTNSIQYSMKDFLLLGIEQLNQKCFFIWKITGDLDDEATFQRIEEHTRKINSLQLSPNELILASCDDGGIIKLWERDNEQENLFRCYQTLGKNDTFAAYKCDIQGANIDENLQKLIHQTSNRIKYQFI